MSTENGADSRDRRPRSPLPDIELLTVKDVAAFHGRTEQTITKRIRSAMECPGWHKPGKEWVVRRTTYVRWLDKQEGLLED